MIRTEKRLRLARTWLMINLCFIWGNSLLPGEISGQLSDWVKDILAELLSLTFSGDLGGGGLLRKLAHFTEFTLLGACLGWLCSMVNKKPAAALAWGVGAACMDETIQRFVPDRGPSLKDVGIDTCGVLTGIMLLHLGHYWIHNRKKQIGGK